MTNSKSMKLTALLLAGVLATSCFVGGTLARYVTSTSSEDSARVAVWGINADEVTMDLFDATYTVNGVTVAQSEDGDNIIAPGTEKDNYFSIVNLDDNLKPEVMYEVAINLDDSEIAPLILNNPSIVWRLDEGTYGTWEETKAQILALSGDASGVKTYAPLEIAENFKAGKTHKIGWKWIMDNNNNVMDTEMGNKAVDGDISAKIVIKVTARQVDSTVEESASILKHNGIIPVGGTYYVGATSNSINTGEYSYVGDYSLATAVYTAGDAFPTEVKDGDVYVYGDYEYRYNYLNVEFWLDNSEQNGWGVRVLDTSKSEYGQIIQEINNKPTTSLSSTFSGCNSLEKSPIIPETVVDMMETFGNSSLTIAPKIPTNVTNMMYTFLNCDNLIGEIEINATNLTNYNGCFNDVSQPLVLTGSCPQLEEIANRYNNITLQR